MPALATSASWKTQQHLTLLLWAKVGASKLHFDLHKGLRSRLLSSKHSVTYPNSIWNHLGLKDERLTGGWDPPRVKPCRRTLFGDHPSQWDALAKTSKTRAAASLPENNLSNRFHLSQDNVNYSLKVLPYFNCEWSLENQLRCKKLHLQVWTGESTSKQLVALCLPIQIAVLKPKGLQT